MTTLNADASLPPPFPAYQGQEPYIFVSYAHKDKHFVYPDIKRLHDGGYRIWYDDGIVPGEDFPKEIDAAIRGCAFSMLFVSPHAIASRYVRRELHRILDLDKHLLLVHLEPVGDLPDGFALQVAGIQAIMRHELSAEDYRRKLDVALPATLRAGAAPAGGAASRLLDTRARLALDTTPPGAAVFIDDADTGLRTPCEYAENLKRQPARTALLEMKRTGFEEACYEVELRRGERVPVSVTLIPLPSSPPPAPTEPAVAAARPPAPADDDLVLVAPPSPAPATPTGTAIPVQHDIEWVTIPAGDFLYGEDKERKYLPTFQMMKYPVTVAQYRHFCTATGRQMPDAPQWGWQDTHPVVNVTWEDAAAFAAYAGGALPTEEEWEKAARGTDGRVYPWGNEWDAANAHCSQKEWCDAQQTAPVGYYQAGVSPYGCLDMAGNVWEWCANWYDSAEKSRVLRGGGWSYYSPDYFRTTYRSNLNPTSGINLDGFRCVLRSPDTGNPTGDASPAGLGLDWVTIPAGEFRYGGRKVKKSLPAFSIMKTPVTVAQYRHFCTATGRQMPDAPSWGWQDTHPVVNVTWDDAAAFAAYAGAALPTEEEWEKAARGTDGRAYPWGNAWDAAKAHCSKKEWGDAQQTAPVGRYPAGASPYGCLDLAGNVWEWCDSWYDNKKDTRVVRGGGWVTNDPDYFRATYRRSYAPTNWGLNRGFRCVLRSPGP